MCDSMTDGFEELGITPVASQTNPSFCCYIAHSFMFEGVGPSMSNHRIMQI